MRERRAGALRLQAQGGRGWSGGKGCVRGSGVGCGRERWGDAEEGGLAVLSIAPSTKPETHLPAPLPARPPPAAAGAWARARL